MTDKTASILQNELRAALGRRDFGAAFDCVTRLMTVESESLTWPDLALKITVKREDSAKETRAVISAAQHLIDHTKMSAIGAFNLGLRLRKQGLYRCAIMAYHKSLALSIEKPHEVWTNIGVVYVDDLHDRKAAEHAFSTAITLCPDALPAYINLGNIYEEHGEFDAAIALYERACRDAPPAYEALARLGHCTARSADSPILARMTAAVTALEREATPPASLAPQARLDRESLLYSIGAFQDGVGDYRAAFDSFTRANDHTELPLYNRAQQEAQFDAIIKAFPTVLFKIGGRDRDTLPPAMPAPIFICGMFRSGSTLIEQVIGGHADVTSCGELSFFERAARNPALLHHIGTPMPEGIVERLRREYFATPIVNDVQTPFFTDKRPDNILYLGLIRQVFPRVKIIHTQRNARDNALSVFFTQFGPGQSYARDLDDIAHYQDQQARLARHWQQCFGDDFITVSYDAFVQSPEITTREMLGALHLTWDAACLNFHSRRNRVSTASYKQVRQKLYKTASGRAENYAFAFDR